MAAHDPYWRLFESQSLPAPGYETPEEIRAALADVAVGSSNSDSTAVRPEVYTGGDGPLRAPDGALAMLLPRPADTVIAVPAAFSPDADPAETTPARAPELALRNALALASAPSPAALHLPAPGDRSGAMLPVVAALEPVVVPDAPAPFRGRADAASEQALALARAERIRTQRRLALAGFDPRGFDGVFGPRTREAIAAYQVASGFPSTGYLDAAVLDDLRTRTEDAYTALLARADRAPRAAPTRAPVAEARRLASAGQTGACARDADGRILAHQSFVCDVKGLAEKVVSLGRNKLAHEEDATMALNGASSFGTTAGDRR